MEPALQLYFTHLWHTSDDLRARLASGRVVVEDPRASPAGASRSQFSARLLLLPPWLE